MAWQYDLVVVGTGSAASSIAMRCRGAGWAVAVVDRRRLGGTCPLRGCNPKKVLVGAAEAVDLARRLADRGVDAGQVGIDWPRLMQFKRSFTDPVPESRASSFAEAGIEVFRGTARFTGPNTLEVDGEPLQSRYVVLAAGAEPAPLPVPGAEHLATSDDFLELDALPGRIVLVGGGYIAFEFAHIARRAGAEVIMLERDEQVLGPFEPDLVGWLVEKTRALGIELRTGTAVEAVERRGAGFAVRAGGETLEADLVVHAAGRVPALAALDLETGGVQQDDGRLRLNEYLQSVSNPAVYAAGDAAQMGPPLTPVASHDATIVAANLLRGNHVTPDYSGTPSIVFTLPPLATVGLREDEAEAQGLRCVVNCAQTSGWFANRRVNEDAAGYKVVLEAETGRILGAHLLGPQADELINLFALAIRTGLTADDLKSAIFGYPTSASNLDSML